MALSKRQREVIVLVTYVPRKGGDIDTITVTVPAKDWVMHARRALPPGDWAVLGIQRFTPRQQHRRTMAHPYVAAKITYRMPDGKMREEWETLPAWSWKLARKIGPMLDAPWHWLTDEWQRFLYAVGALAVLGIVLSIGSHYEIPWWGQALILAGIAALVLAWASWPSAERVPSSTRRG